MKIEMPLNASPEANAVAHWGIIPQCCRKFGKLSEELII
jgi:hypothetical protein